MKNQTFTILAISLILIGTLMPMIGQGVPAMKNLSTLHIDKWCHFILFFFLGFSIVKEHARHALLTIGFWFAILLGVGTECLQECIPGRGFEYMDILADSLGTIFGFFIGGSRINFSLH